MVPVAQLNATTPALELDSDGTPTAPVVVIDVDDAALGPDELVRAAASLRSSRALTVALTRGADVLEPIATAADVSLAYQPAGRDHAHAGTVGTADPVATAAELVERVAHAPRAALTLSWLLRAGVGLDVPEALAAESVAYSMLLGSREFGRWLADRNRRDLSADVPDGERVRLHRSGDDLTITLARPARRNAVDARMRDALVDALAVAEADPHIAVTIVGAGPSFCAGGDLDEFGTADDPATAHVVRVAASPAAALHRLRDRVTVRLHGACIGAGVELPAFAGAVVAAPDAQFGLPEIAMGLIPGAGGTVSIPRRIGRQRALWFALSGHRLDAATAWAWGLVDRVESVVETAAER
jgi:enoyl-CoA hydratase/carnithine racemase